MIYRKGLLALVAVCATFAMTGCDEDDDPAPVKKEAFSTLTQVSMPGVSCKMSYNAGDTLISAQLKKGNDVVDLTFGYDPYQVLEKSTIDMENYTHNYQNIAEKKGKVVSMISVNRENVDSVQYTYDGSHILTSKIVSWENDTTKHVYEKTYQWDGDKLSKLNLFCQTFMGDSVCTPTLDEYTFSYQMSGGPVVHWQFFFPIIMNVDFSWAGYAELFFSLKTNGLPYYAKAVHYPDANNKNLSSRKTYSITSSNKTDNVTIIVSCQDGSGEYWQKECKLTY